MPQFYTSISPALQSWALSQPLFFTASAPLTGSHINISPKGHPAHTLSILSPTTAAYLDATGSGCETISHVYENARLTLMFCSFDANPRILRLFCSARVVEWDTPEFETLLARMGKAPVPGARAIVCLDIWKVQTSCGYGVPLLTPKGSDTPPATAAGPTPSEVERATTHGFTDRPTLSNWVATRIERNELLGYQVKNNVRSLDGLPGLRAARREKGEGLWVGEVSAGVRRVWGQREAFWWGVVAALVVVALGRVVTGVLMGKG